MNPTSSTRDLPILSIDQSNTTSMPSFGSSDQRQFAWTTILTLPHRRRAVAEYACDRPATLGCNIP